MQSMSLDTPDYSTSSGGADGRDLVVNLTKGNGQSLKIFKHEIAYCSYLRQSNTSTDDSNYMHITFGHPSNSQITDPTPPCVLPHT